MKRKYNCLETLDEYDSKGITSSSLVPCSQVREYADTHKGIDCLSQLPKSILECVLLHLTMRDVFRTGLVSHYFKNECSSLTRLRFDKHNMLLANEDDHENGCCGVNKRKFVRSTHQFLKFYQGTKLPKFYLDFCLGADDKDDIDTWIRFVSEKDVKKLQLNFFCRRRIKSSFKGTPLEEILNLKPYVLSGDLFGGLNKLKLLYLIGCTFDRGLLADFNSLVTLDLAYMDLTQCDLQSKLQFMPKLKYFIARRVFFPVKLSFGCLPLLNVIHLNHCFGVDEVELCNAALNKLYTNFHKVVKCNLSGISKLISLGINADEDILRYIFTRLAQDQPLLESLHIFSGSHWGSGIPEGINKFSHLKELSMHMWKHSRFDILKLINVLRASSLLRKFTLVTNCTEDVEWSKPELSESVHQCLEEVCMSGPFLFPSSQIEFLIYVLKSTPALKKLILKKRVKSKDFVMERTPWDQDQREYIHERIKDALDGDRDVKVVLKP